MSYLIMMITTIIGGVGWPFASCMSPHFWKPSFKLQVFRKFDTAEHFFS